MPAAGGNAERAITRQANSPRTARAQGNQLQDRSGLRLNTNTALRQAAHGNTGDIRGATASNRWDAATGGMESWARWDSHDAGSRNGQRDTPNWWERSGSVSQPATVTTGGQGENDRLDYAEQWEAFGDAGSHLNMSTDFYNRQQQRFGGTGGGAQHNFYADLF